MRLQYFLAQDVIHSSRAYATMSSVRLSVTFVHCGHRVQWIPDIFACLDRWMSLLLTDRLTRIVGWDDVGISGGRGGIKKLVIVAISLILLIESLDQKHVTVLFISTMLTFL